MLIKERVVRVLFQALLCIALSVPVFVFAQNSLVPCNGPECRACDLVSMGQGIINWFIFAMATICALVVAVAGFKMVTAGGNTGQVSAAKDMMTNVVIGFIILLSAWLIVDTVMKTFVKEGVLFGPWNEVECVSAPKYVPTTTTPSPTTPTTPSTPAPSTVTGCSTSCSLIPSGITIKDGACGGSAGCTVSSEIAPNLSTLATKLDSADVDWRITEAYPPTREHRNPCHAAGTCIDANCIGSCSASQVKTFIESAQSSGLRAVYEVGTEAQKNALVSSGVPSGSIQVLGGWISAPHFSVYKN